MSTSRHALRHFTFLVMILGLFSIGTTLVARGDGALVQKAGAQSFGYIQIAPAGTFTWSDELGPVWVLDNGGPGDSISGAIQIRAVDVPDPAATSLKISAELEASIGELASYLVISQLTLGGVDLLAFWDESCKPGGKLFLTALAGCEVPRLPMPPDGAGVLLSMTLLVDPDAGNEIQGLSTGMVSFMFTLEQLETDPPTAENGTIVVIYDGPAGLSPGYFTLSVSGPSGVTGPGPLQTASFVALNENRIVSLVGPQYVDIDDVRYNVLLQGVYCVSDTRGDVSVPQAWAVTVSLADADEVLECTFEADFGAGTQLYDDPTPTPTSTPTPGGEATETPDTETPVTETPTGEPTQHPGGDPTGTPAGEATRTPAAETPTAEPTGTAPGESPTTTAAASPTPGAPSAGTGTIDTTTLGFGFIGMAVIMALIWGTSGMLSLVAVRRRSR